MAPNVRVGKYIVKKKIGEGAFAEVRLAVHQDTNVEYAVKVFNRQLLQKNRFENDVKKEIRIMQHLRHPNIVSIHAVLVTASKMYLVMEYVKGGELYDEIVSKGRIDEDTSRNYFQQLVDAMSYCHRRGVVHRDLKPENLLLDGHGNLKVTDFGMSFMKATTHDVNNLLLSTQCGTPKYMAPEVIMRPPEGYDGRKLDVWECGMVLFALLAGYLPFHGDDDNSVFRSILSGTVKFPKFFSEGAKDLLRLLLEKNPNKRASLEDVRKHPWFLVNYKGDPRYAAKRVSSRDAKPSPNVAAPNASNIVPPIPPFNRAAAENKGPSRDDGFPPKQTANPVTSTAPVPHIPVPIATSPGKPRMAPADHGKLNIPPATVTSRPYKETSAFSSPKPQKRLSMIESPMTTPARPAKINDNFTQSPEAAATDNMCPPTPVTQWREDLRLDLLKLEKEPNEPEYLESPVLPTPAGGVGSRSSSPFQSKPSATCSKSAKRKSTKDIAASGSPAARSSSPKDAAASSSPTAKHTSPTHVSSTAGRGSGADEGLGLPPAKAEPPTNRDRDTEKDAYLDYSLGSAPSSLRLPLSYRKFTSKPENPLDRDSSGPMSFSPSASMKAIFRSLRIMGSPAKADRGADDEEGTNSSWFNGNAAGSPVSVTGRADAELTATKTQLDLNGSRPPEAVEAPKSFGWRLFNRSAFR